MRRFMPRSCIIILLLIYLLWGLKLNFSQLQKSNNLSRGKRSTSDFSRLTKSDTTIHDGVNSDMNNDDNSTDSDNNSTEVPFHYELFTYTAIMEEDKITVEPATILENQSTQNKSKDLEEKSGSSKFNFSIFPDLNFTSLNSSRTSQQLSCVNLHFSKVNLPLTALSSYQGSGNTWARHLIQQLTGIHTGSIYNDDLELKRAGFLGENWSNGSVVAIKTHAGYSIEDARRSFNRTILIIRNPFNALLSEFNRRKSKSHINIIKQGSFNETKWVNFLKTEIPQWNYINKLWFRIPDMCIHVIEYTNLVNNLKEELFKLRSFLGVEINEYSEAHINCILNNSEGMFKRKERPYMDPDIYDSATRNLLKSHIDDVKNIALINRNIRLNISEETGTI